MKISPPKKEEEKNQFYNKLKCGCTGKEECEDIRARTPSKFFIHFFFFYSTKFMLSFTLSLRPTDALL